MRKRKRLPSTTLIDGVLSGDRLMLSRAITLVESSLPADQEQAREILQAIHPHSQKSFRIGITGVPGVGKSTFIDAFGSLLTKRGQSLAVLAIDPSSQKTRGSILGDKTRMNRLSQDKLAYIRPSPTAGSLGGVARKSRESMLLCEAAGFNLILVETVGVGQSEIAVHGMVDCFLLLMLPNAGDDLQGIKKGIMEMADLLVINKADGNLVNKAKVAKAQYNQALRLFPIGESGWRTTTRICSALEGVGLAEIWESLLRFKTHMQEGGFWDSRRKQQQMDWMNESLQQQLEDLFFQHPAIPKQLEAVKADILSGHLSPTRAADQLIQYWKTQLDL
ncbi:MAG: methylmalonyl Co-A mutase-associated GTPase MeaB [Bacteroidota bacterium]